MITRRLVSLDAFRGLTIALMILVNNTGSWEHSLPPLRHADWHGWTLTDLVFPFFLFISGISLVFSLDSRLARGDSRNQILAKILRRALILFALGLFLNLFPLFQFSRLRIPGVLQRIAICYAAAALLYLWLKKKGLVMTCALLLLGYWLVMTLVPVPGHGAGRLTPEGNLAAWLDGILLKGTRFYRGTWDPEGVLSTFPAIASTLLGVLCGCYLASGSAWARKSKVLLAWGAVGIGAGLLWNLIFPINKNLWTSSYVLFTAGWAMLALAPFLYLCEHRQRRAWAAPLLYFGVNPITAYVLSSMLTNALWTIPLRSGPPPLSLHEWLYQNLFASWASPVLAALLFALTIVLLWLAIMSIFYRHKIIIRI